MPQHQCKLTISSNQDSISLLEPSNPTKLSPKKCSLTEAQDKDFKIAVINMIKDHKRTGNQNSEMK